MQSLSGRHRPGRRAAGVPGCPGLVAQDARAWPGAADDGSRERSADQRADPCFNEEKVIVASVTRILGSHWRRLEMLVLDDGSVDGTALSCAKPSAPSRGALVSSKTAARRGPQPGLALTHGDIVVAWTLTRCSRRTPSQARAMVRRSRWGGRRQRHRRQPPHLITRWQGLEYCHTCAESRTPRPGRLAR